MRLLLLLLAMVPLLAGCATLEHPGAPKPAFPIDADIKALNAKFGSATSIESYYTSGETEAGRNAFISGRLTLYNLQYIKFISSLYADTAQIESAFDITKLGIDLATTMAGGSETKAILGAISAGITGSRLSIAKNFLQDKTIPVLIGEMNAQRKVALQPILQGMALDTTAYPLGTAIVDLQSYYEAGTFAGALQSIQKNAGVREAAADKTLDALRSVVFTEDASVPKLAAYIWPNGDRTQPPNDANLIKLRTWLGSNVPAGTPIATFLRAPTMAALRAKAITDLNIP